MTRLHRWIVWFADRWAVWLLAGLLVALAVSR